MNAWLGEDTIQSTWASRTHTPPQRPLKGPGRACEGALRSCFVLLYSAPIMPRDGANLLSDVRVPVLTVVCEPCGRRERYDVERLTKQNGRTAKLTDLLPALVADCPKRGSVSVYDRCKAVFVRRARRGAWGWMNPPCFVFPLCSIYPPPVPRDFITSLT